MVSGEIQIANQSVAFLQDLQRHLHHGWRHRFGGAKTVAAWSKSQQAAVRSQALLCQSV
jgi:hypothetical protein